MNKFQKDTKLILLQNALKDRNNTISKLKEDLENADRLYENLKSKYESIKKRLESMEKYYDS